MTDFTPYQPRPATLLESLAFRAVNPPYDWHSYALAVAGLKSPDKPGAAPIVEEF